MPVRLAEFSAALLSAAAVAGCAAPGHIHLTFDLDFSGATAIDLHAALRNETSQQTETWLFRWTPE